MSWKISATTSCITNVGHTNFHLVRLVLNFICPNDGLILDQISCNRFVTCFHISFFSVLGADFSPRIERQAVPTAIGPLITLAGGTMMFNCSSQGRPGHVSWFRQKTTCRSLTMIKFCRTCKIDCALYITPKRVITISS